MHPGGCIAQRPNRERTRVILCASRWHMSWGYWGIVGGLLAMVGMLLACFTLLYPKRKEPLPTQSDRTEAPSMASSRAPDSQRKAA